MAGRLGRRGRALCLRGAVVLVLLAAPATFPAAGAAFSATTGDTGNSVATGTVSPPSGLSASQVCTAATITLRGATSANSTNGSLVLTTPAGTAADDILIAHVTNRYDDSYPLTAPSGWLRLDRVSTGSGANQVTSAAYWRRATTGEPASATFTLTGGSGVGMVGGVVAYTGVDVGTPLNASATVVGSGLTVTTPSLTTTVPGTRLIHLVTKLSEAQPAPSGSSQRWRLLSPTSGDNQGSTGADEALAASGSTGTRSSTGTLSTPWIVHTGALKPASVPSASLTWTASTSTSTGATGYTLERVVAGTVTATKNVSPITATATTDGPLVSGTSYTFRLSAYRGTWRSARIATTVTPSC